VFERFTERARHALVLAQDESRELGHDYIGTEHLLLGVVREGGNPSAIVLERYGMTIDALRSRLTPGEGPGGTGVPFTPGAKRVLEQALKESLHLGDGDIEPEHLLLALTTEDATGGAGALIHGLGGEPERVRRDLVEMLPKRAAPQRLRLGGRRLRPSPIGAGKAVSGAVCPVCLAPLRGQLRHETIDARPPGEPESAEVRPVVVLYCGSCGAALGATPT
jgi:hypothetical protein